jgi:hypothetical protein
MKYISETIASLVKNLIKDPNFNTSLIDINEKTKLKISSMQDSLDSLTKKIEEIDKRNKKIKSDIKYLEEIKEKSMFLENLVIEAKENHNLFHVKIKSMLEKHSIETINYHSAMENMAKQTGLRFDKYVEELKND